MSIQGLLQELDERVIVDRVGRFHDDARISYRLAGNTVPNFDEFTHVIADYYNHHFTRCVAGGGGLSRSEAAGRAKELLERQRRRGEGDIVGDFNDANGGTNGGLRVVLDKIADGLKAECVERYIRDAFDRHVAPNDWDQKVEIIRQFIRQAGANLASSIHADQPERCAGDYRELIRSYVDSLRNTSSMFRRL